MRDVKPNLPVRKTLDVPVIEKAEVPGVDYCVGSNMGGQFVYDSELAVGVADQQKSHTPVFSSTT